MLFQFLSTFLIADSVDRLPLQALIDEISRFFVPAFRDVILLYCHLTCEDLIADIFTRAAFIGALTHHAFISNDTDCKIICSQTMILTTHDFGRHVSWRSTCLSEVFGSEDARYSEVSQPQVTLVIKYEVFWLDITMYNQLLMDGFQGMYQTSNKEACNVHCELSFAGDMVPQITAKKQVHHQVQVHVVLKGVMNIDNELALDH